MKRNIPLRTLLTAYVLGMLSGCGVLNPSYHSLTTHKYPPKPKDFPIALFNEAPKQKFKAIGCLTLRGTYYSDDQTLKPFTQEEIMQAIQSKARRVGADAVVFLRKDWHAKQYVETEPAHWVNPSSPSPPPKNATPSQMAEYKRSCRDSFNGLPQYAPDWTRTTNRTTYLFETQMIVFR